MNTTETLAQDYLTKQHASQLLHGSTSHDPMLDFTLHKIKTVSKVQGNMLHLSITGWNSSKPVDVSMILKPYDAKYKVKTFHIENDKGLITATLQRR